MNEMPTRLLRETLRARTATSPSRECLDAETVAAWADGALTPQHRATAEAHAADCARCQALVAALAKTSPPAAARPWWRMPALGWLVPLTAAAAALIVWVSVSNRTVSMPSARLMPAKTETVAAPVPAASSAQRERKLDAKPADQLAAAKVAPGPNARPAGPPQRAASRRDAEQGAARESNAPAPAQANTLADNVRVASAPAASVPPAPQAPPAAAAAAAAPIGAAAERASARMVLDVRPPQTPIVSSNPNNRWRILAGGAVQHSTDGGSTWQAESTGVTVTLTAGASPSPTVCWLVGPGGIVLLSSDGRSWQRIAFPEAIDLASVRPTDDKSATVTTSDGRAFSTTDGGKTWTRSP